jgi:hypothetical protein
MEKRVMNFRTTIGSILAIVLMEVGFVFGNILQIQRMGLI